MASGQTANFPQVTVDRSNNANLGYKFEDEVAISFMCTLNHNEGLVKELKLPDKKFNDIVIIKDVKQTGNNTDYELLYYQLKHKENPNETLTWNSLVKRNDWLYLGTYFDSYGKLKSIKLTAGREVIKELCIMTNAGLSSSNSTGLTSLTSIRRIQLTHCITQGDVATYFRKENSGGLALNLLKGERFKFSPTGIDQVTECFFPSVNGVPHARAADFKEFLELLVFYVKVTAAEKLKEDNNTFLRLFFPFHWDEANREKCCQEIKTAMLRPFDNKTETVVDWVDVQKRCSEFNRLRESFGARHPFGSGVTSFIGEIIDKKLLQEFNLSENVSSSWLTQAVITDSISPRNTSERLPLNILNIMHREGSNPAKGSSIQALVLKAYAILRNESLHQRTRVIQAENEDGMHNMIEYFKSLSEQASNFGEFITEGFFCVIALAPGFEEAGNREIIKSLIQNLNNMKSLRRWVQFIVVTQSAISRSMKMESVEDSLEWNQLAPDTKKCLLEKTLYLDTGNDDFLAETKLRALGFDEDNTGEWMHPRALSELVFHCQQKPLSLGLPKKDANLDNDYIEREVQLPLVKNDERNQKENLVTCSENDFKSSELRQDRLRRSQDLDPSDCSATKTPEYQHLLSPVASNQYKDACLWVKAKNGKSILALQDSVVRSKDSDYAISETHLLGDDVNFGTGSTDSKLLVVVDYPGKGKSCLLAKLSNRFLEQRSSRYSNCLLVTVNLREISNWESAPKNSPIEFLLDRLKTLERDSIKAGNACLSRAIVSHKCVSNPPSVFVLLDGYDEIGDEQRQTTLRVIDELKTRKGIKRIILTSRPEANLENELEQRFGQFSLHLNKLTKRDQISYLVKRWSSKRKSCGNGQNLRVAIQNFAEKLVDFAARNLKDENATFLDIPLQCRIFAECFNKELEDFLNKRVPSKFKFQRFELLHLYDKFYESKMDVLFDEKANMPNGGNPMLSSLRSEMKESFLQTMMRLSIFHMMHETHDAEAIARLSWDTYRRETKRKDGSNSEYSKDVKRAMKLGIVRGSSDDNGSLTKPQNINFQHRTFAEYFFARYLFEHFADEESELFHDENMSSGRTIDERFELIVSKIFGATEYAGVRRFLDRMLAKHVPPVGKLCLFAREDRSNVLEKWPVIAHERFNEQLAKSIITKNAGYYAQLSFRSIAHANNLPEEDYEHLCRQLCNRNGLGRRSHIIVQDSNGVPCVTSMLIHCIKEYATRQNTSSEDREKLAYSVILSLVSDVAPSQATSCLLHWFDPPVPRSSNEASNVFSNWIFIFLNALTRETQGAYHDLVVRTCKMLEHHRNDSAHFEGNVFHIATSRLFKMAFRDSNNKTSAKRFCEVDVTDSFDYWNEPREIRSTLAKTHSVPSR